MLDQTKSRNSYKLTRGFFRDFLVFINKMCSSNITWYYCKFDREYLTINNNGHWIKDLKNEYITNHLITYKAVVLHNGRKGWQLQVDVTEFGTTLVEAERSPCLECAPPQWSQSAEKWWMSCQWTHAHQSPANPNKVRNKNNKKG